MQHNPLAGIRFEQTVGVVCEKCSSKIFSEGYMLRKVSKFLVAATTDKDQIIPVPVFYCVSCGHVNSEFTPEGMKAEEAEVLDDN